MNDDKSLQIQVVGMVWYERENYERIRSMCEDGHNLHDTYDEWLQAAETLFKSIENQGKKVVRANLDPDEFALWCKTNGTQLNAAARNAFANEVAYKTGLLDV